MTKESISHKIYSITNDSNWISVVILQEESTVLTTKGQTKHVDDMSTLEKESDSVRCSVVSNSM